MPRFPFRLGDGLILPDNPAIMSLRFLLFAVWLAAALSARADDRMVKRFDGHNSLTTADFTVPDGWEIRWHSDQVLSLGVIRRDNTVIAGTTGRNLGSLYLPQGGTYRIRVKGTDPIIWDVTVFVLDKKTPPQAVSDYYTPTDGPAYKQLASTPSTNAPSTNAPATVPDAMADDTSLFGEPVVPPPAPPPAPAPPPLPTQLSPDQLHCIVVIKGDRTTGTGFFVKLGPEKLIVTTQQLIANNPNWQVFASNGDQVQVTKIEGATDRDVALLSVKDFGYAALEVGKPGDAQAGDAVLTGSGSGKLFPPSNLAALGPRRFEIPRLGAAPGGPVVLAKSGQVVGIVAVGPQLAGATNFGSQNFDDRDAAVANSTVPFGLRFDNLPGRETYDLSKLQTQSQFLDTFHQHSRILDAYLNGNGEMRDDKLWQSDEKIKLANDNFVADVAGGDPAERTDALHTLLFELGLAADVDFDQVQIPANFYTFPGQRAKEETAYRQAIKTQLESYSSNMSALNSAAARNNN